MEVHGIQLAANRRYGIEVSKMPGTLERMGRKRNSNPGNPSKKRSRSPMQIPLTWWPVLNQLSNLKKRPALWIVLDLISQEATKEGIALPLAPWETGYSEKDGERPEK